MVSYKALSALVATTATVAATSPNTLNVTVLGAQNNHSTLECWALNPGFQQSSTAGTSGSDALNLGLVGGNASFSILPARFDGGLHNAPALQCVSSFSFSFSSGAMANYAHRWVIFLSGLAHITLPHSNADAWVDGGKNGAILALDTAAVSAEGHYTRYPSDEETVALQVPVGENAVPGHRVLHEGACKGSEVGV